MVRECVCVRVWGPRGGVDSCALAPVHNIWCISTRTKQLTTFTHHFRGPASTSTSHAPATAATQRSSLRHREHWSPCWVTLGRKWLHQTTRENSCRYSIKFPYAWKPLLVYSVDTQPAKKLFKSKSYWGHQYSKICHEKDGIEVSCICEKLTF